MSAPAEDSFLVRHGGFLVAAVLAALVCFTQFHSPLQEPQEARYAEIPRQMLAEGSFVVPVLHGQPYYDKPPLFYWTVMASYALFGVHDWAARLVACTVAFLCILVVHGWAWRTAGARAALLCAVILCLSPRFIQLARMVTMDGLLCLWVVSAWAAASIALRKQSEPSQATVSGCHAHRFGWACERLHVPPGTPTQSGGRGTEISMGWLLSAVACGLGLLTKGPVALVLVLVPLLAWSCLDRETQRPTLRMLAVYAAVSIGLAAPWFVAVALRDSSFLEYFFWRHHVERYVDPFDHAEPFWYYLPELLGGMLPWTLLLPGVARSVCKGDGAAVRCGLIAAAWCVCFFSLAGCKRAFYILPAMPALALALGSWLDQTMPRGISSADAWRQLVEHRSPVAFRLLLVALLLGGGGTLTATISGLLTPTVGVLAIGAMLGGGILALAAGKSRQWQASWLPCGLTMTLLVLASAQFLLPSYARRFSLRGQIAAHAVLTDVPVYSYPRRWDSVSFYLQRGDVQSFTPDRLPQLMEELLQQPEALLFIKARHEDVLAQLPPALAFERVGRQGALIVGRVVRAD